MALNLKNPEVERLAAEVARLTGESKTEAIRRSLEECRQRLRGTPASERRRRVLRSLDSSALVAILFAEPGYLDLVDRILQADVVRVGAPTLVETEIVLSGRRRRPAATVMPVLCSGCGGVRLALVRGRRFQVHRHHARLG
jgi:hypothetical protein